MVFFLFQPGGLLIESADSSDAVASVTAAGSNAALSNITAMVIALGLVMTTLGLYVLQSGVRDGGPGDALSRAGLILIVFGNVGWVLAQGLTLALADAQGPAIQAMVPVYMVRSGIVLMSGIAVALGFLLFSVALSTRDDFNKIAARIVALASLVAMVSFIVAVSATSMLRHGDLHRQGLLPRMDGVAHHAGRGPAQGGRVRYCRGLGGGATAASHRAPSPPKGRDRIGPASRQEGSGWQ